MLFYTASSVASVASLFTLGPTPTLAVEAIALARETSPGVPSEVGDLGVTVSGQALASFDVRFQIDVPTRLEVGGVLHRVGEYENDVTNGAGMRTAVQLRLPGRFVVRPPGFVLIPGVTLPPDNPGPDAILFFGESGPTDADTP